ncbi:hypothetical protein Salat_1793400 [Sesamum alatum]|uniref:Pectinesterase inhibitor domain-containing protein n=1 Tax=Sesamum alatum TaxID=300844 RepID=A0AAE1Y954_9LAMI|nr:hypothetical protein Salat_1793400 [Sesamum alatum]
MFVLFTFLWLSSLVCRCSSLTITSSTLIIRDDVKAAQSSSSSSSSSSDLIQSICSQTQNRGYCQQFLQQLYRPGESLGDLGQSAFDSVSKLIFFTYDEIHVREVGSSINDPVLNKIYHKCGGQYTAAINALNKAKAFLKSGDYGKLPNLVSLALNQPPLCDSNFTPPTQEPAEIKKLNNQARDDCAILFAISNRLASGKNL